MGRTAVHAAARCGHEECFRLLWQLPNPHGPPAQLHLLRDLRGKHALDYLFERGHTRPSPNPNPNPKPNPSPSPNPNPEQVASFLEPPPRSRPMYAGSVREALGGATLGEILARYWRDTSEILGRD